jgi:hypothetical protein
MMHHDTVGLAVGCLHPLGGAAFLRQITLLLGHGVDKDM